MITAAEWFADRDKQYEAEINAIVARVDAALCDAQEMPVRVRLGTSPDDSPPAAVQDAVQAIVREAGWRTEFFDEYDRGARTQLARIFIVYGRRL